MPAVRPRFRALAAFALLCACAPAARSQETVALDLHGKADYYLKTTFSPLAAARLAATTAYWHSIDLDGWPGGAGGYGERYASRYGSHVIQRSAGFAVGALHGEDPRFRASGRTGLWSRTAFVLSRTVVTDMDRGRPSIAAGKLAGFVTGNVLAASWHPLNPNPWKRGLSDTALSLASDVATRILREFWPEITGRRNRGDAGTGAGR